PRRTPVPAPGRRRSGRRRRWPAGSVRSSSGTLLLGDGPGRGHGAPAAWPGGPLGRGGPWLHLQPFGLDQIVEPPDVGLGGRKLVVHERQRVVVDGLPVAAERVLEGGPPALQEGP